MKIHKAIQEIILGLFSFPLSFIEKWILKNNKSKTIPVFIIGVPRSGTTLLYQLMIQSFRFSYIPNISRIIDRAPVLAARLTKFFLREHKEYFKSSFGEIKGLMAPSEAGRVWNRWYPIAKKEGYNYSDENELSSFEKKQVSMMVKGFEKTFRSPFINKNVKHSVRIRSLIDIFPNALFLWMRRNDLETAVSILDSRRKNNGDISEWWSVMPREIKKLKNLHYLDQIAGQICFIKKNIAQDRESIGRNKILSINYKDLCQRPKEELKKIKKFFSRNGLILKDKESEVPNSFSPSQRYKQVTKEEERILKKKIYKFCGSSYN
jgi:hypothetical protein